MSAGGEPVVWAGAVRIFPERPQSDERAAARDELIAGLGEDGIECRPGFVPASDMSQYDCPQLKNARRLGDSVVCLPTFAELRDEDVLRVCERLGKLTGKDLVHSIRNQFGYPKGLLPVLVMTGDANLANQSDLLRAGANDLVEKPIEERLLVTKLLFQLRVGRLLREKNAVRA